jgi:transcription elongation factor Elf1
MEFKCPHCNIEIKVEDMVHFDFDIGYVHCKMLGVCPECGRTYTWRELYKYEKSYEFTLAD